MVFLWLCCEGWKLIGSYRYVSMSKTALVDDQDNVIAIWDGSTGKRLEFIVISHGDRLSSPRPMYTPIPTGGRHNHPAAANYGVSVACVPDPLPRRGSRHHAILSGHDLPCTALERAA